MCIKISDSQILVTIIIFLLIRLAPGDPVLVYAGEERDPEQLAIIRRSLGLDQPLPVQYVFWIGRAVQGEPGAGPGGPQVVCRRRQGGEGARRGDLSPERPGLRGRGAGLAEPGKVPGQLED